MLNMKEFGKRVQAIREQVLEMSQSELAEKINTSQVLLSRIENGIGGSINVVFDLVNYLNSKILLQRKFNLITRTNQFLLRLNLFEERVIRRLTLYHQ